MADSDIFDVNAVSHLVTAPGVSGVEQSASMSTPHLQLNKHAAPLNASITMSHNFQVALTTVPCLQQTLAFKVVSVVAAALARGPCANGFGSYAH